MHSRRASPPQTTTLSTCVNKRIQWSGGRPPYSVRVFPGGQLDADPLAVIALNTQDTNAVWRCTVQAGQSVTFAVEDDNGDVNGSAQVTVSEKCVLGAHHLCSSYADDPRAPVIVYLQSLGRQQLPVRRQPLNDLDLRRRRHLSLLGLALCLCLGLVGRSFVRLCFLELGHVGICSLPVVGCRFGASVVLSRTLSVLLTPGECSAGSAAHPRSPCLQSSRAAASSSSSKAADAAETGPAAASCVPPAPGLSESSPD